MVTKWRGFDRFFTFSDRNHYLWKVLLDRNGRAVLSSIVLYFFGLERHNFTKKHPPGVSFSAVFSNSLNMKRRRVLPLSDSLKLNDIGTRRNDASSSICYPRQACHPKIIGVLARNGGGNKGTVIVVIGSMSLLNMALFAFVSGWGHLISLHFCLHGFGLSYLATHLLIVLSLRPPIIWPQILPNPS